MAAVANHSRADESPTTVIEPWTKFGLRELRELAEYRELLWILGRRDVQVRYQQAVIGAGWALVQPVMTMVIFTVIFNRFAHVSSGGSPYAVLVFAGLLPWQLFSQGLSKSTLSVVTNGSLVSKVYFPRLILPLASLGSPLFDFFVAILVLVVLLAVYGLVPTIGVLAVPGFMAMALLAAFAGGVWLSAANARFRDVSLVMPLIIQIGTYLSPVAFPITVVPQRWRFLYDLNPMVGPILGFRWAFLGDAAPSLGLVVGNVATLLALTAGGIAFFNRTEKNVADYI